MQIRRTPISIPTNIAERAASRSKREFIWYLCVSLVPLSELETKLTIPKNIGYEVQKMILGLINLLKKGIKNV